MIALVKAWYSHKLSAYKQLEEAEGVLEQNLRALAEASNIVTERSDEGGWSRSLLSREKGHNFADQQSMLSQARKFFRFDPNGKAAIMTMVFYVIGEGVTITPQSKDPRVHKLWREFWRSPRNGIGGMKVKFIELVLRTFRDGECFIQYFTRKEDGDSTWKTSIRFRDPALLKTPPMEYYRGQAGSADDGILMDPNDHEKPLKYFFRKDFNSTEVDVIDAKDMQHIKIFADSDQKRGESYIQSIMEMLQNYKDWMQYRIVLNKVRTSIVLIRKIVGGSQDVQNIKATLRQSPTAKSGEAKKRVPPPGTIINANAGVDYEFKSPNINATDAAEDGRNIKLSMAAGTNLPEYVFGDASNANFASTMIAESPFVKGIKFWQLLFEAHAAEMFRRVLQAAVDAQKIVPPPEEDIFSAEGETPVEEAEEKEKLPVPAKGKEKVPPKEGEEEDPEGERPDLKAITEAEAFWGCDAQWPEVVHREIDKTTNAVIAQKNAGIISDATAASILGHDYEEEVRKQKLIDAESADNPFKKADPFGQQDLQGLFDQGAEEDDLMSSLTPEEKKQILDGDSATVAAFVKKKLGGLRKPKAKPKAEEE